ncbi:hypothetical protein PM3016_4582 [Paenibacillus mucilaginosus 3016]|uniref:Uncharacterized protein n=1 Tax=Paenibacillus mucilaginosus 3016 TaxID=1116391 RepID=H6NDJ0_9BACL|nr:hypothetical protein PM3016_4582 [Paenibacillus mucilaginosus 3016]
MYALYIRSVFYSRIRHTLHPFFSGKLPFRFRTGLSPLRNGDRRENKRKSHRGCFAFLANFWFDRPAPFFHLFCMFLIRSPTKPPVCTGSPMESREPGAIPSKNVRPPGRRVAAAQQAAVCNHHRSMPVFPTRTSAICLSPPSPAASRAETGSSAAAERSVWADRRDAAGGA